MNSKKYMKRATVSMLAMSTLATTATPVFALENATNDKDVQVAKNVGFEEDKTTGVLKIRGDESQIKEKVREAKELGLEVNTTTEYLGTAHTDEEIVLKETEIENKLNTEENKVNGVVDSYKEEVARVNAENQRIENENNRLTDEYNTAKQVYETEKARIEQENVDKERKYQEDLQAYHNEVAENERKQREYETATTNYENDKTRVERENQAKKDAYDTYEREYEAKLVELTEKAKTQNEYLKTPHGQAFKLGDNVGAQSRVISNSNFITYDELIRANYIVAVEPRTNWSQEDWIADRKLATGSREAFYSPFYAGGQFANTTKIPQRILKSTNPDFPFMNRTQGAEYVWTVKVTEGEKVSVEYTNLTNVSYNGKQIDRMIIDYTFTGLGESGVGTAFLFNNPEGTGYVLAGGPTFPAEKIGQIGLFNEITNKWERFKGKDIGLNEKTFDFGAHLNINHQLRFFNGNEEVKIDTAPALLGLNSLSTNRPLTDGFAAEQAGGNGELIEISGSIMKIVGDKLKAVHSEAVNMYAEAQASSVSDEYDVYGNPYYYKWSGAMKFKEGITPSVNISSDTGIWYALGTQIPAKEIPDYYNPTPEYEELPNKPTLPKTTNPSKPEVDAPEYTLLDLPVEPLQPTLLPKLTDPIKPVIDYKNFEFDYMPQAQKFIIDLEGNDLHNKLIFKNSKFNYVLTPPTLQENRDEIKEITFTDVIPTGLEVEFLDDLNTDYTYTYNTDTRTVVFTLKSEKLAELNANKSVEITLKPIFIKAQAKNDSAVYLNNAEFKVITTKDNVDNQFKDTTKIVITGTPGDKTTPNNPGDTVIPPAINGDSNVNPEPVKTIQNQLFNKDEEHTVEFTLNWHIKPYENISLGKDDLLGLSGLVDFYSDNLEFVEIVNVKDVDGTELDRTKFAIVNYENNQIMKDDSNIKNHDNRKWEEFDFGNKYTVIVPLDENGNPTLPNYVSGKDLIFTVRMKLDNTKAPYKAENKVAQYDRGNGYLGNVVEVQPKGNATYEFISGTPNEDLPQEIIDLTPNATDMVDYGTNVDADKSFETVKNFGDYEWRFESFDKDSDVVDGIRDHFVGTWIKYGRPTFEFKTKDGSELPQEVKDLLPIVEEYTKYTEETKEVLPVEKEVVLGNDKYVFDSYDKSTDITDGDDVYTGTWIKSSKPTYEYVSLTPNEELPEDVIKQLPIYKGDYIEVGNEAVRENTNEITVITPTHKWVFRGYDKDKDVIDGDDVFKGAWVKQGNPVYEFRSYDGRELPQEVLDLLPKDETFYDYGTNANVIQPRLTEVKTSNGTWKFVAYDRATEVIDGKDDKFVGTWNFIPKTTVPKTNDSTMLTSLSGLLLSAFGLISIRRKNKNK